MKRPPTQELFAGELRRLRLAAGLSQESLGERVNYSASLVSAVEQCRRPPRLDFVAQCDSVLGAQGLLVRIRESMSREALVPWFREWVDIEQEAIALRSFEPLVVPGLLQTEAYATELLIGAGCLSAEAAEPLVASRLARQTILARPTPPLLVAVIDQGVLHHPVGGPPVMRDQLLHILSAAQRPNVHVHVVPRTAGAYPGLNGAFVIATTAERDDVAYLDNQLLGTMVGHPSEVIQLWRAWEAVRAEALPRQQSCELITEVADAWI